MVFRTTAGRSGQGVIPVEAEVLEAEAARQAAAAASAAAAPVTVVGVTISGGGVVSGSGAQAASLRHPKWWYRHIHIEKSVTGQQAVAIASSIELGIGLDFLLNLGIPKWVDLALEAGVRPTNAHEVAAALLAGARDPYRCGKIKIEILGSVAHGIQVKVYWTEAGTLPDGTPACKSAIRRSGRLSAAAAWRRLGRVRALVLPA